MVLGVVIWRSECVRLQILFFIIFFERKLQGELKCFILSFPTFLFSALSIALIHCTSQWADDEFSVRCIQWSAGVFFSWESCEFCSQQGVVFFFPYLNIFPSSGHVVLSWVKFQLSQLGMLHEQFYSQLLFCVLNVLQSWLVMCYCFQEIKHLFTM